MTVASAYPTETKEKSQKHEIQIRLTDDSIERMTAATTQWKMVRQSNGRPEANKSMIVVKFVLINTIFAYEISLKEYQKHFQFE